MPIDANFPEGLKPIGKINHSDGEHFHWIWGPGKSDADASKNEDVIKAYEARGEKQVPLSVSGTMIAVAFLLILKSPFSDPRINTITRN